MAAFLLLCMRAKPAGLPIQDRMPGLAGRSSKESTNVNMSQSRQWYLEHKKKYKKNVFTVGLNYDLGLSNELAKLTIKSYT